MASKKKATPVQFAEKAPQSIGRAFYNLQLDDEQLAFASAIWNPDVDIVFVDAKAGTGKTTIAAGVANLLVHYGLFNEIIYIMSPYGERKQGWLPGTITEKSSVYFEALYQALVECDVNINTAINTESMTNQKNGTGFVTCITDTFLRGSNLNNAVIIIDEAQNFTVPQLQKVLTRVGKNAKVVVIGHELQCDLDDPAKSGFTTYIKHFAEHDRVAICKLTQNYRSWISQWADEVNHSGGVQ